MNSAMRNLTMLMAMTATAAYNGLPFDEEPIEITRNARPPRPVNPNITLRKERRKVRVKAKKLK